DEVIVIRRGRIVAQSTVAELTGAASGGVVVAAADLDGLAAALQRAGAEVTAADGHLVIAGLDAEHVGQVALGAGIALRELRTMTAELEDVFMELTAGGGIA
ncbi:MAG: ABC transporter ATP-binding protein, partial [Actinomycetota bacterium]